MTPLSVQEWDCGEWEAGRAGSGVVGCAEVGRRAESDGDEVVVGRPRPVSQSVSVAARFDWRVPDDGLGNHPVSPVGGFTISLATVPSGRSVDQAVC